METIPVLQSLKDLEKSSSALIHFADEKGNLKSISHAELVQKARRVAAGLHRAGVKSGEPVVLVATEPESAIVVILGCMMAGCPPAPIYPPQNIAAVPLFLKYVKHVADRAEASFFIADDQPFRIAGGVTKQSKSLRGMTRTGSLLSGDFRDFSFNGKTENPIAFLQFTSGSTSIPKGVLVTHEGLAENLRMIREACDMNERSSVVTWLPVYHDMGLIGTVLNALTLPCNLVVLPPLLFLKKPRLWLELITQYHGTHTAAPNFAYGLCARRIVEPRGVDLRSMTTFICGAEPVLPRTMEAFVQNFQVSGLSPGAMVPAYGLAEATLAVTFSPHGRGLASESVDRDKLSTERSAVLSADDNQNLRIASCGIPMRGLEVRIASDAGAALPDRSVGEIQIKGSSVTPGYIGDPQTTRDSRTADGWLRTGDLGYMVSNELFPCGRLKEIVIIRGKKYHAHDLENLASEVHGVRTGNVVAFSSQRNGSESLIVVAESRHPEKNENLGKQVRAHIAESMGISPDEVMIVPAGTLPKTSSGKLKRLETRELFEQNALLDKPSALSSIWAIAKSRLFKG